MTNMNISVIIATLGGDKIKDTLENLNNSSIVPKEIIICIPEQYASNVEHLIYSNIKVLKTTVRGQVAQRVVGFQNAKYPFVLQLDDDITLDYYCLEKLLDTVVSKKNIAAGPKLYDHFTKEYQSFLIPLNTELDWFNKIFYFFANGKNGFQPGKISKSGMNFGLPETPNTFYNVDWLCGGCLMHRKENLILFDYYPLSGKAYAEDLFHSKLLRDNNVILVRSGGAKCFVDFTSSKVGSLFNFISNYPKQLNAMKIFVKSINASIIRMYLVNLLMLVRLLLLKKNTKNLH